MVEREALRTAERIASRCYARRVRSLSRGVTRVYDEALRPFGLTAAQLNLLVAIALMGEARASDLVEHLDIEKSTLSRSLGRMLEHGWVAAEAAGREQRLSLCPLGGRLLRDAYPAWQRAQQQVRKHYGDAVLEGLDAL